MQAMRSRKKNDWSSGRRKKLPWQPPNFEVRNKPQLEPATVVKNARIGAIIKRNSETPLLRCPREIRDKIWTYVVGSIGTIHLTTQRDEDLCRCVRRVHHECDKILMHEICDPGFKEECLTRYEIPDLYRVLVGKPMADHHYCWWPNNSYGRPKFGQSNSIKRIDLNFLLSCRQLYLEATEVMYKQTVFSFRSPEALSEFTLSRNQLQKRCLRKIHLDVSKWWRFGKSVGDKVIEELPVDQLKSIKTLQLSYSWPLVERLPFPGSTKFRVLDLETVTIDAYALDGDEFLIEDGERVREMFLDPNGASMRAEVEREEAARKCAAQLEKERAKERKKRKLGMEPETRLQSKRLVRSTNGWVRRDNASG